MVLCSVTTSVGMNLHAYGRRAVRICGLRSLDIRVSYSSDIIPSIRKCTSTVECRRQALEHSTVSLRGLIYGPHPRHLPIHDRTGVAFIHRFSHFCLVWVLGCERLRFLIGIAEFVARSSLCRIF